MRTFLANELQRALDKQSELSPDTIEYAQVMVNLERLAYSSELYDTVHQFIRENTEAEEENVGGPKLYVINADTNTLEEAPTCRVDCVATYEKNDDEVEPDSEDCDTEEPQPTTGGEVPHYEPEEVRAALVVARTKGVSVKDLLNEFGVDNFSSFPAGRYHELMARVKALTEAEA